MDDSDTFWVSLIDEAREFAYKHHAGQSYGTSPFTHHLEMASEVAEEFDLPEIIRIVVWLHDILEDTDVTIEMLQEKFGELVAKMVYAVTDKEGANRAERHRNTYPQMKKVGGFVAVGAKLCDRIANFESALQNGEHKIAIMYANEYKYFKDTLYEENRHRKLWAHLDKLIGDFNVLYEKKLNELPQLREDDGQSNS